MVLQNLKEKTSAQHKQLESHPLLHQLTSPHLSIAVYTTILQKFYGFFYPLEQLISQYSPEYYLEDFKERRKAQLLLQDLKQIDKNNKEHAPDICQDLPLISNIDCAMGALYVMEGSTLGGQMISRHVEKTLGYTPSEGTAFFNGYGKETGKRWKKFQEALCRFGTQRATHQQLITSAQNTFSKLNTWLSL